MQFLTKRREKLQKTREKSQKKQAEELATAKNQLLLRNRELLQKKSLKSKSLKEKVQDFRRKKQESLGKDSKNRVKSAVSAEIYREKLEKLVIFGFSAKKLNFLIKELSFKEISSSRARKTAEIAEKARISQEKLAKTRRKALEKLANEQKKRQIAENVDKKVAQLLVSKEITEFFARFQQETAYFFDFFRTNVELQEIPSFSAENLQFKGLVFFAFFCEIAEKALSFKEIQLVYRSSCRNLMLSGRIPIGFSIFSAKFAYFLEKYAVFLLFLNNFRDRTQFRAVSQRFTADFFEKT